MRFPPSLLDEIRAKLPASSVIGRRVKLKRQGREFAALAFKQEKTPSFTVNDQKGFYHCFASGEHGDIFRLFDENRRNRFSRGGRAARGRSGRRNARMSTQAEAREALTVRLRKVAEASCVFFQDALRGGAGREARAYLERRGLERTRRRSSAFASAMRRKAGTSSRTISTAKGFTPDDMAAAGMLISGEDIPVSYDRFRHRLMFPIADMRGQVIAFGGRALGDDQQPKYLNSPETPLFHKGGVLFNAAAARQAAHERGGVIVAEGYMDVIALTRPAFPTRSRRSALR